MKNQSIKKNYILNTIYQVFALITPLITTPYISRVLSADGVGIYSYTSSVVAIFTMFACLGTTTYGQREIARCRDDIENRTKTFWEIEILSICSTLISMVAWIMFIIVYPEYTLYFLIFSIDLISTGFDISWLYSGLEHFNYIVFRNIIIKILGIILIFLLVKTKNDVWIYICILSVTKLLGNISMWISLSKFVNKINIKKINIKPHISQTIIYFIPTAAASIYTYLDKVMLGFFTTTTLENGYYEQANKIIKIAYTLVVSLNTVMSSRISYLFALDNVNEIKDKLEQALAFILTIGIPMVFGISSVSFNFVGWFFGDGYEKVIILMILGSPLVVIMSFHNFLSAQYLVPSGQRARSTKGVLIGAAINFTLNLLLIPYLQSIGAIIATLIAESSICIVYLYMSQEYVPIKLVLKYLPKQLFAGVLMSIIVLFIGCGHSGNIVITIIQIIVGVVVYFITLILLKEKFICGMLNELRKKLPYLHN